MSSSLSRPASRLGAAATAAALLVLMGTAAHAGGTTPDDEATVTTQPGQPGEDEEPTPPLEEEPNPTDPVEEEPAPADPGEEDPAPADPVEEEPAPTDPVEELPTEPGEWLDPAVWTWILQEEGVVDAACFAAELPAPGEYLVADQDYLLVVDMAGIQSEDTLEIWAYGELVGDPIVAGDVIEVGTDPANDAVILCTGTMPADFDGELPVDGELPGGNDSDDDAGGAAGGGSGTGTVGGRADDGGKALGPVVQTDRPVQHDTSLATGGLVLAAAAGLTALGLRRRVEN